MKKRKQPFENLQDQYTRPYTEHRGIKFPREEVIDTAKKREHDAVWTDKKKQIEEVKKRGGMKYSIVHSHPNYRMDVTVGPSITDLYDFLYDPNAQSFHIVLYDEEHESPIQAIALKKTKETPSPEKIGFSNLKLDYNEFLNGLMHIPILGRFIPTEVQRIEEIMNEYKIKKRHIPHVGYTREWMQKYRDALRERQEEQTQQIGLEAQVARFIFIGSLISLIFLSIPTLTGNTIINIPQTISNRLFLICLLASIISGIIFLIKSHSIKK